MKAKEQLLDFINSILAILLIGFVIYFFTIPGNFERFQALLYSFAPLVFFAATLIIRMKLTSKAIKEEGEFSNEDAFIRLTHWDKIKLELILTGLPIVLIIWTIISDSQGWQTIGQAVLVFIINSLVLRSIFKKAN